MERELKKVKVGDQLYLPSKYGGGGVGTLLTVTRITDKGRVVCGTVDEMTFMPDGRMVGSRGHDVRYARPATDEDIRDVTRNRQNRRLGKVRWEAAPQHLIDAVIAILDAAKQESSGY